MSIIFGIFIVFGIPIMGLYRIYNRYDSKPCVRLIIPYPGLLTYKPYKTKYSLLKELLYKPDNSIFVELVELDTLELYKHLNIELILDYKWNTFGFGYYIGILIFYIVFLLSFAIATSTSPDQLSDNNRNSLLTTTIVLGAIHLTVEVRQFIWKPLRYITDFWNYFGVMLFYYYHLY